MAACQLLDKAVEKDLIGMMSLLVKIREFLREETVGICGQSFIVKAVPRRVGQTLRAFHDKFIGACYLGIRALQTSRSEDLSEVVMQFNTITGDGSQGYGPDKN